MSKLNRIDAIKQAKRLQSCPMIAPQTDEGRREIVDCLVRHCQSAEHADSVMTRFLDEALKVEGPVTAALANIARQVPSGEEAPAGCERCFSGKNPVTGEKLYAHHVGRDVPGGYSVAVRCSCERGRWLASREQGNGAGAGSDRKPATRHEHANDADWAKRAAGDL